MFIDVKYTVWQRAHFSDEADVEEIIGEIEKEHINAKSELPEVIYDDTFGFIENEVLFNTENYIAAYENGAATINVYNDDGEKVWTNFEEI